MSDPRIDFDANVPPEIVASLSRLLSKYFWVLPAWVRRIYVFNGTDPENPLEVMGERSYRRMQLYVAPHYLSMTEKQRDESVLHEMCHIVTEPVRFKYKSLLDFLLEKEGISEDLHAKLSAEYVEECEGMTQDLTFSIMDFLDEMRKN